MTNLIKRIEKYRLSGYAISIVLNNRQIAASICISGLILTLRDGTCSMAFDFYFYDRLSSIIANCCKLLLNSDRIAIGFCVTEPVWIKGWHLHDNILTFLFPTQRTFLTKQTYGCLRI